MISVCIATYNGSRFINEQLSSILPQLGKDDEVVVSDDGSTDDTLKIIEDFDDERITILVNSERHGVIGNFENALRNAHGEYIFLSDQDDVWAPDKVRKCMNLLEACDMVLHNMQFMNSDKPDFFSIRKARTGIIRNLCRNSYSGCCMAFRRKVLSWCLPFPKSIPMHDVWMGIMTEIEGKVIFTNDCLLQYRIHENNASFNNVGKSGFSLYTKAKQRFLLAQNLLARTIKITLFKKKG